MTELPSVNTTAICKDNIIILLQDEEGIIAKLKQILTVCVEFKLNINFKNCQFLKKKVELLGYVVKDRKMKPSPSKTLAVQNFL